MGTAAPLAPGPVPSGGGHPAPSTPFGGSPGFRGDLAVDPNLLQHTHWQQAGCLGTLWLPRGLGRGHRAGRSMTASPRPQRQNTPLRGFLAAWYPPCPGGTPTPDSRHCCPTPGSSSSSVLPHQHYHPRRGESSRCLAPACPCPQLPRAHPGPVSAGRSGRPGLPRARRSCVPATRRAAICSHQWGSGSRGGQELAPTTLAGEVGWAAACSGQGQPLPLERSPQGCA